VRGASWFAPVLLKLKDWDDYEDAALLKQKIAACLAVITSDTDGTAPALGGTNTEKPEQDMLEPGMILNVAPGRSINVVQPPTISEHGEYARATLRAIATGLGVTYEDLVGDYTGLPFSAARMSRLRHWARVDDWRWRMLIPQFCDPVWQWAMLAARVAGMLEEAPRAQWTAPPMPLLDPDAEGTALQRLVRIGALTWPEMVRERGYDPDDVLREIADWNARFDALGVVLDSDPRKVSQQGQPSPAAKSTAPEPATNGNGAGA
jgi:lambda family phage portal protein